MPQGEAEPRQVVESPLQQYYNPTDLSPVMSFLDSKEPQVAHKPSAMGETDTARPVVTSIPEKLIEFKGQPALDAIVPREMVREVTAVPAPLVENPSSQETFLNPPSGINAENEVEQEFAEKMPGFTPEPVLGLFDSGMPANVPTGQEGDIPGLVRRTEFKNLDNVLEYRLATYADQRDGQKFFELSLRVHNKDVDMPIIPKEIIFLIDASISIRQERLAQFQQGLSQCLQNLNPEDLFNVIIFKEEAVKYNEKSLPATPENIRGAIAFLQWFKAGEKTDTYDALHKLISEEHPRPPSYIMLLSDGWPTQGVTDSRQLINEITNFNGGRTCIFAYSGGSWVNRYLLDFIAYKNRGWTEYSAREHLIGKNMLELYNKIRNPVLLNLRYRVSGVPDDYVYPKMLTDFFKNAEFTLYGRYDQEEKIVVQLLGDVQGETKEFIATALFKDAVKGDKEIARNWAFNKIYDLIGQMQYNQDNSKLLEPIKILSDRFGIKTPYSKDIQ